MTVLEAIQRGAAFLEGKGVDSPRLQSELILAHVLGIPRLQLYLRFDRVLSEDETGRCRELLRRRGLREPLQHLLGTAAFCGLEFRVTPEVLIPRPETELLAERAWSALQDAGSGPFEVLDFGTGSGCLAVAILAHCPAAHVWAIDCSPAALAVARENAVRHGVDARLTFACGDCFGALPAGLAFHLLVANPPYVPSGEIDALQPEVRDHDPRLALDGGPDGLGFYRLLAAEGPGWLRPGGVLLAELGAGQAGPVQTLLEQHKWVVDGVDPDYSGWPRIVRARWIGEAARTSSLS